MTRFLRTGLLVMALITAAGLAGCGSDEGAANMRRAQEIRFDRGDCQQVGKTAEGSIELCFKPNVDDHGRFLLSGDSGESELAITPPGPTPSAPAAGLVGHWAWAALSPDGKMVLAQWSAECEVPIAFLVPASGGSPTPITGEKDWAKSPDSVALGWTTEGRAIAFLPTGPACGSGVHTAGVYLYSSPGEGKLFLPGKRSPIEGSTTPRPVSALRQSS